MRGSSWPVLADLRPTLGGHVRTVWPAYLGDIGRFCGPSLGSGGWLLEAPPDVENQRIWKNKRKRKYFIQILDRFVRPGVQDLGLGSGRGPKSKIGST